MDIKKQQSVLQELQPIFDMAFVNYVVAGGCARDWSLGKECTDIDIWIPTGAFSGIEEFKDKVVDNLASLIGVKVESKTKEAYSNKEVVAVYKFEYEGVKFDICLVRFTHPVWDVGAFRKTVFDSFGASICKTSIDSKTLEFSHSPEFTEAVKTKVIQYGANAERLLEKLKKKFPEADDWTHNTGLTIDLTMKNNPFFICPEDKEKYFKDAPGFVKSLATELDKLELLSNIVSAYLLNGEEEDEVYSAYEGFHDVVRAAGFVQWVDCLRAIHGKDVEVKLPNYINYLIKTGYGLLNKLEEGGISNRFKEKGLLKRKREEAVFDPEKWHRILREVDIRGVEPQPQ